MLIVYKISNKLMQALNKKDKELKSRKSKFLQKSEF